jgi:osmotically-inducible protein OsmY
MPMLRVLVTLLLLLLPVVAADQVSDDVLFDQVRVRLANDREVGGGKIEVTVTNGNVELTGKVKSEKIKEKAEKLVKRVKGVKSVSNRLTVGPT